MPDAKEGPRENMGDEEKKINSFSDNVQYFDVKQNFCNISRGLHTYMYTYMKKSCWKQAFDFKMCLIKKNTDKI